MYMTLACFFNFFFQVAGKLANYSDSFFPAEHDYRSLFFLSRSTFPKLYVKIQKGS